MPIFVGAGKNPMPKPLRVVFMGTPQLAAHILERLVAESAAHSGFAANPACQAHGRGPHVQFEVVAVVTRPERPQGRGLVVEASPVAQSGARLGLAVYKPTNLREPDFLNRVRELAPDVLVVAAYGRILPAELLALARLMPVNVHASLLPRHRGASPVEAAILAGDSETGVTIMRMTERMDAGPILLQRAIGIAPTDTQASLKMRLAELGAQALLDALVAIAQGTVRETPQDEAQATYCKPVKKEDAWVDWRADAVYIERMTRAYDPWPVARTRLLGQELLIFKARALPELTASEAAPGTIMKVQPIPLVSCGKGVLELVEVQTAGRKRMAAADFMRGRRVVPGVRLGE